MSLIDKVNICLETVHHHQANAQRFVPSTENIIIILSNESWLYNVYVLWPKIDSFLTFTLTNFLVRTLQEILILYIFCPWKYEKTNLKSRIL